MFSHLDKFSDRDRFHWTLFLPRGCKHFKFLCI